jgi:hypothetical protein
MEKSTFSNLINGLSVIAEKDKWVPRYDPELDYFYWTKEPLREDARLVKVSHETSLYFTPDRKIQGVFVEYLKNNFVAHNKAYGNFVKQFKKKIGDGLYTIEKPKEAEKYLFGLGEALRADIYQDAKEKGDVINFEKLLRFALSR